MILELVSSCQSAGYQMSTMTARPSSSGHLVPGRQMDIWESTRRAINTWRRCTVKPGDLLVYSENGVYVFIYGIVLDIKDSPNGLGIARVWTPDGRISERCMSYLKDYMAVIE